ncbi:MAG: hypothetical protein O7D30_04455 [Rickettsia endosymbiont of Ixodes persulcatus]|nr:hypothetical protein [Rickettsia endosymbiont of Ixodes persulcatus]
MLFSYVIPAKAGMTIKPNMIHSKEFLNSILRQDFHSFIIKVFNTINPRLEYYPI